MHPACDLVLLPAGALNGAEKPTKDGSSRGFRELKEALKILESLKNMTVEQLWTGGSPTSPTSAEPASTTPITTPAATAGAEKPTKEKRFLDDIKKLQENLRKTLDNVAIVEEEKMEAVVGAGGSFQGPEVGGGSSGESEESSVLWMFSPWLCRWSELVRRSSSRSCRHQWGEPTGPASV